MIKLDIGCGPNKKQGFVGVDQYPFDGAVDVVMDVVSDPWPWEENSVEEAYTSHFVEHLTAMQRIMFFNKLYKALKHGGQATIIVPHWSSCRAYGDPTHQWPPIGEFFFFYLDKDWREKNAPHTDARVMPSGYDCDFSATWGYSMHGSLSSRNTEYQQFAVNFYKEAAQDIHATITKK